MVLLNMINQVEWLEEWKTSGQTIFGKREVLSDIHQINNADAKITVKCECGNISSVKARYLYKRGISSCGKCLNFKALQNTSRKWGKLTLTSELTLELKGNSRATAICECGQVVHTALRQILAGKRKDCGSCAVVEINRTGRVVYGKYRLIDELSTVLHFNQKVNVLCECGNTRIVYYRNLITGNSKSCGECEVTEFRKRNDSTFGKLTVVDDLQSIKSLSQQVNVVCACGKTSRKKLFNLYNGHTTSCGSCYESLRYWWSENVEKVKSLVYPISQSEFHFKYKIKNVINAGRTRIDGQCFLCGKPWNPVFKDIIRGITLSCGCATYQSSNQAREIEELLAQHVTTSREYPIGQFKFDVAVESKKLLIEFHGLKWHSESRKGNTDLQKFRLAKQKGYSVVAIFEDEWRDKRKIMESILLNKIMVRSGLKIRSSKVEIKWVNSKVADVFYDGYHYLGKTTSTKNVVAFYNDEIIAAMSFKSPNRQSNYDFELTRYSSNSNYQCQGLASKLFKEFIRKNPGASVVSFSDNRLFDGGVYSILGFHKDGDVRPDYYWQKGRRRYHKSNLRKPPGESRTETTMRRDEGYEKIWDYGKVRWVWTPNGDRNE